MNEDKINLELLKHEKRIRELQNYSRKQQIILIIAISVIIILIIIGV